MLESKNLLCVVPTHLFGLPADVKRLKDMINSPEVTVLEDAAQAMGGEWRGKKLGTLGDVSFFSLGRGKAFSTVEGGVILTDSEELAANLKMQIGKIPNYTHSETFKLFLYTVVLNLLLHPMLFWIPKSLPFLKLGETIFDPDFEIKKLSSFQAGLAKNWVDKLQSFRQVRQENTKGLLSILDMEGFKMFVEGQADVPDLIRFPIEMQDERERIEFLDIANQRGLGAAIAYPSAINGITELATKFGDENYPLAEKHSKLLVTLPVHLFCTKNDQKAFVSALKFTS